jgi:hypothetical protein
MPKFKYLFEAHLSDGTLIQQTPEDISTTDPTRSSFYDVQQRIDDVEFFGIYNEHNTYTVDLSDGHFEVNGEPFNAGDPQVQLPTDAKFRLIYFRRNKLNFAANCEGMEQTSHEVSYFIGWQVTVDGKNYQQTISVS